MFAVMGLGPQEILLLALLGAGGVAALVIALRSSGRGRAADLEAEDRRLREELDRRDGRA